MSDPGHAALLDAHDHRGRAEVEPVDRWPLRMWIVAGVGLTMAALLMLHIHGANGPPYFPWGWRRASLGSTIAIASLAAAQAAIALWATRPGVRMALAIAALTIGSVALRFGASVALSDPPGLDYARVIVREPTIGSFFSFAQGLRAGDWTMADFPELMRMPGVPLHVVNKPPGPTMFWYALLRPGIDAGRVATIGIVLVALMSGAAVPLIAIVVHTMGGRASQARHAAGLLSMAPGAIAFFPMFDPAYTTVSLALMALWFASLRHDSNVLAAIAGLAVAGSLFVAFHLLPVGLFMLAAGWVVVGGDAVARAKRIAGNAAAAGIACAAGVIAMRIGFGYDAVATFGVAVEAQRTLIERFGTAHRPYPATVGWDAYDLALGVGFVPIALVMLFIIRPRGQRVAAAMAWCGVGTLAVVAIAALLPGEGARVWNFLFPLVVIPAAFELSRSSRRDATVAYAMFALVLVATMVDLRFMGVSSLIER